MTIERMETVLGSMAKMTPKAPEKTVSNMVRTVQALERERDRRAAKTAGKTAVKTQEKTLKPKTLEHRKKPDAPTMGRR
ncbi:MAG: hypothetical protein IJ645_09010 [Ruminococcus sp.]|nr:hypothetical protein [Ruminococcus sp.]